MKSQNDAKKIFFLVIYVYFTYLIFFFLVYFFYIWTHVKVHESCLMTNLKKDFFLAFCILNKFLIIWTVKIKRQKKNWMKKKNQNDRMHTGLRTVRWARQPDGRCSVPGHPGVGGQSWGLRRPATRPSQGGPSRHHEVGGHEAGCHQAGRQAARQRGRVHLGELGQLLWLPAKKKRVNIEKNIDHDCRYRCVNIYIYVYMYMCLNTHTYT